jgi:hypothetical protein
MLRAIEQTHRINQLGAADHGEASTELHYAFKVNAAREKLSELRIAVIDAEKGREW